MKDIEKIVRDIVEIYRQSGIDAENYLNKARQLEETFGLGLAIIYCWFYSVPQKWTQVEPKIFELMMITDSFDLNSMLSVSKEELAEMLKPTIFYNEISLQLKNFCKAIQQEHESWEFFAKEIREVDIFSIFSRLRKHKGIRLTFKNLAAMKSFVGPFNHFLILDTHVARVLGIGKDVRNKYKVRKNMFKDLLMSSNQITQALKAEGLEKMTTIQWSLAIWFNKAKIRANDLLPQFHKTI